MGSARQKTLAGIRAVQLPARLTLPYAAAMRSLVLAVFLFAVPAHALTDEQRTQLVEHFGKLKDLQDFSAGAVDAALGDPAFKDFFDGYSKLITVVQLADQLASAKDKEAMQLLAGEGAKAAMEYAAKKLPGTALAAGVSAFNFLSWANTGLGLFKDFVFDPALEQAQLDTYMQLRGALDPEDAAAKTFGWGYMREKALKQLEKQGFNMDLLWEGGVKGKLSKQWEAKLEQFVVSSFEAKYVRKLVAESSKAASRELPALDGQAKRALEQHRNDAGDEGRFAGDIVTTQGKKVEFWINGKAPPLKDGRFTLDRSNTFTVRMVAVGARRQQSRDLKAKPPGAVTLDGVPTDHAFAYSAGKNASAWKVTEESYDAKVQAKLGKVTAQSKRSSRPAVQNDVLVFTLADDTANETITIDVSGHVKWAMSGTRANGAAASDSADESETGAIVLHVAPRK